MNKAVKKWLFALALTLPMVAFYAGYYFNHAPHLIPTGFIGYDNVSYVAYAKEYLDSDTFSLFYSNPFGDSGNHPKIYFQTQTALLAFLLALGFSPGFTIVLLNWLGTLLSFRMAISLFDHLYPSSTHRKLFITFFCWGGGLLAIAGIPIAITQDMGNLDFLDRIFFIDPAWGWWGLNFGRGHFISTEGYYHFLFLAGILCILKKKWGLALLVSFILSFSHPFTGIEYLAIVAVWTGVEKFFLKAKEIPWVFFIGIVLITCFHVIYYLFYLNQFPEHRSVSEQYALNWRLRYFNMLPAYCLVGTLALIGFIKAKKQFFKEPSTRLFTLWFMVAFLLANHELFMKPMQPLHFTRGYVWTSLFLLGLPALHFFFNKRKTAKWKFVLVLFSVLMLSDNFLWITNSVRFTAASPSTGYITREQQQILEILKNKSNNQTLIVSRDEWLPYLSTVYTNAYPWVSHPFTTPNVAKKQTALENYIANGVIEESWRERDLIFIFRKGVGQEMIRFHMLPNEAIVIADTENYVVAKAVLKH